MISAREICMMQSIEFEEHKQFLIRIGVGVHSIYCFSHARGCACAWPLLLLPNTLHCLTHVHPPCHACIHFAPAYLPIVIVPARHTVGDTSVGTTRFEHQPCTLQNDCSERDIPCITKQFLAVHVSSQTPLK